MERTRCVLCGKEIMSIGCAYFERGISKKDFLCGNCYNKRTDLHDYSANEKKRSSAAAFFEKRVVNKSPIIQDIVRGWINGEEKNYYPDVSGLVYYVEGKSAVLFVFKDHVTILSNYVSTRANVEDYVYFYKCKVRESERKVTEREKIFVRYDDKYEMDDLQKIRADILTERVSGWTQENVQLNISVGTRGTLEFGIKKCFEFFYHQNQLMEEVYNYIQRRIAEPDEDVDGTEALSFGNKSNGVTAKLTQKKEEMKAVFSPADEIKKMKELLDCGILTQDEFEKAKNKLIDMM